MNLRSLGEFGLIGRIASQVGKGGGVSRGIGDDAAVLLPAQGKEQLVTSDMLLEGVHFDLSYTPPNLLGRKSLAVNLSDMAAMGGEPRWFLLSLGIPETVHLDFLDHFISGLLEIAAEYDVTLVGGDTCASKCGLVISITLIGEQHPEKVIYRSGARAGDIVCVTGTLGDSGLGLTELAAGRRSGHAVDRHLNPSPRCREALILAEAGIPSAMIDISDGFVADLGHILELSGVGARVQTDRIPRSQYFHDNAAALVSEPMQLALTGGEDYELLFTAAPDRLEDINRLLHGLVRVENVATVTAESSLELITTDGSQFDPATTGFRHF